MRNLNIGIDIDEVIANSVDSFLPLLNRKFNKNFLRNDLVQYRFENSFGISSEEMNEFWRDFSIENGWKKMPPYPNTREIINRWNLDNNVYFVTSRPKKHLHDITVEWIDSNGYEYKKIIFSESGSKVTDAYNQGVKLDVLIEDYLDFIIDAAEKNVLVFVMNKPWNQYDDSRIANIIRVDSIQMVDYFLLASR